MKRWLIAILSMSAIAASIGSPQARTFDPQSTISADQTQISVLQTEISAIETSSASGTPSSFQPVTFSHNGFQGVHENWQISKVSAFSSSYISGSAVTDRVEARGIFISIYIEITNLSDRPLFAPDSVYQLSDSTGRSFTFNYDATLAACLNNDNCELDRLQPGLPYLNILVFDVAPDASGIIFTTEGRLFEVPLVVKTSG
jgi:hypothetical protein